MTNFLKRAAAIVSLCVFLIVPFSVQADSREDNPASTAAPSNLTAISDEYAAKVALKWEYPFSTSKSKKDASGIIHDQAIFITASGAGYGNADVSQPQLPLTLLGSSASKKLGEWIADDFTLLSESSIDKIDFYVYQPNSGIKLHVNAVYVDIYNDSPLNGGEVVWNGEGANLLSYIEFSNAYRCKAASSISDVSCPIMKVTADINTTLQGGKYWLAVSFETSIDAEAGPYAFPITIFGQTSTGNALYKDAVGVYSWRDDPGTFGLPFTMYGTSESTSLTGFNVYRDGVLLNEQPLTDMEYTDDALDYDTKYCYTVQAVYEGDIVSANSDSACATTIQDAGNSCTIVGAKQAKSYQHPINISYGYSYIQYLVLAEELDLNQRDNIDQIYLSFEYYRPMLIEDITIYIGLTNLTEFPDRYFSLSEMKQVFSGDIEFKILSEDKWFPIPLDDYVTYDGTSNIVVAFLNNSGYKKAQFVWDLITTDQPMARTGVANGRIDPDKLAEGSGSLSDSRCAMRICSSSTSALVCPSPQNLKAEQSEDAYRVSLSWEKPLAVTPMEYNVYRNGTLVQTTSTILSYTDLNVEKNTNYKYEVTAAYNYLDCTESEPIVREVSVVEITCSAPENLSAQQVENAPAVVLAWEKPQNDNPVAYNIYRDGDKIASELIELSYRDAANIDNGRTYKYGVTGIYTKAACNESEPMEVNVTTDIVGIGQLSNSFSIYPNPTAGELRVANSTCDLQQVQLFDAYGKLLLDFSNINQREFVMNISTLAEGLYFIKVDGVTEKVIKR